MDFPIYLAVTAAEFPAAKQTQRPLAWMGCTLSPSTDGITGVPDTLPADSVLVLTDQMPPQGHDHTKVAAALVAAAKRLSCKCILLDFQRPKTEAGCRIVDAVLKMADRPVSVSDGYCENRDCAVFLRPPPLWTKLEDHLSPWGNREIWLEAAQETAMVTVTASGSLYAPCPAIDHYPFRDEELQIAYYHKIQQDQLQVYLYRGKEELRRLLEKAQHLGVSMAIGLFQHLA